MVDDLPDIGRIEVPVEIVETDQGHEVETGRPAPEEVEMPSPVEVVELVEKLLPVERVGLRLQEDPQLPPRLLDGDAAPVDRHLPDISRIDIPVHEFDRFPVVVPEPLQQLPVGLETHMLQAEDGHRIGTERRPDDRQHFVEARGGNGGLREEEEMELFQVARPLRHQVEDRLYLCPLPVRLRQGEPVLRAPEPVGDLGDQAVEMVPERELQVDLFVDDPDHDNNQAEG